jgi:hypothetical protein
MNILLPASLFPNPALFKEKWEAEQMVDELRKSNVQAAITPVVLGHYIQRTKPRIPKKGRK